MSTQIDVKRANNKVDDGTGIKSALFIRIRHNIADVKVTASDASVDDNHLVRVRFEEWDRYVEDVGDEKVSLATLAKTLLKVAYLSTVIAGAISIGSVTWPQPVTTR